MSSLPLTDPALARRLERAEAVANAAFVESRAQLEPHVGAAWTEVAGVYAMFDGPESPITQTFGLGIFEDVGPGEFAALEAFFRDRGAPVCHEVCALASQSVLDLLNARGYRPIEFSSVMMRPTTGDTNAAPPGSTSAGSISVRRINESELDLWSRVAATGWSSESAELATVIEGFGQVIGRARGAHCFIAYRDERPIAAAGLVMNGDVALLAGASTIPDSRRLGAQAALLEARLAFAAEQGVPLAMMVAQPDSGSQRNAERHGFRVVYTRTKWQASPTRG